MFGLKFMLKDEPVSLLLIRPIAVASHCQRAVLRWPTSSSSTASSRCATASTAAEKLSIEHFKASIR